VHKSNLFISDLLKMDKNTKIKSICHIEAHTLFKQCIDSKSHKNQLQPCLKKYKYQIDMCIQSNIYQSVFYPNNIAPSQR
jgi:hypothetical protein